MTDSDIGEHKELIDFIQMNGGKSIIVTKIQNEEALTNIIEYYNPSGIQFHFEHQADLVSVLKLKFPKLLLFGVITNQSKNLDFYSINLLYNYLIYDTSYVGGTNQVSNYDLLNSFPAILKQKTLLAGGITVERINELSTLNANGYDIQSYFRDKAGLNYKNLDKICDIVKFPRKNMLSVSLTDIPLIQMQQSSSYYLNSNVEYHLDFSPGSLYSNFKTANSSIDEKQQYLSQIPYSIHLFIKDVNEIHDKIKKLTLKYPLNLIRVFIQYYDDINMSVFKTENANIKIVPSIYYKDLETFISKSINTPFLSIVVPNPDNKKNIERFIQTFNSNREYFANKEIWLDRNLEQNYIEQLREELNKDLNFIIGKEVISDWSKINTIYECLSK